MVSSGVHRCVPQEVAAEQTVRETVNVVIDAIVSTFQRLLELPLVGVLAGSVVGALVLWGIAWWRARRAGRPWFVRSLRLAGWRLIVANVRQADCTAEYRIVPAGSRRSPQRYSGLRCVSQPGTPLEPATDRNGGLACGSLRVRVGIQEQEPQSRGSRRSRDPVSGG